MVSGRWVGKHEEHEGRKEKAGHCSTIKFLPIPDFGVIVKHLLEHPFPKRKEVTLYNFLRKSPLPCEAN